MTGIIAPPWILTTTAAVTAAAAGIPMAALSYAVPAHGAVRMPQRWWAGGPAPRWATIIIPALTSTAAALACVRRTPATIVPAYWTTAVVGVTLAVIDLRHQRLPHTLINIM